MVGIDLATDTMSVCDSYKHLHEAVPKQALQDHVPALQKATRKCPNWLNLVYLLLSRGLFWIQKKVLLCAIFTSSLNSLQLLRGTGNGMGLYSLNPFPKQASPLSFLSAQIIFSTWSTHPQEKMTKFTLLVSKAALLSEYVDFSTLLCAYSMITFS